MPRVNTAAAATTATATARCVPKRGRAWIAIGATPLTARDPRRIVRALERRGPSIFETAGRVEGRDVHHLGVVGVTKPAVTIDQDDTGLASGQRRQLGDRTLRDRARPATAQGHHGLAAERG